MNPRVESNIEAVFDAMDINNSTTAVLEKNSTELATAVDTRSALSLERAQGRRSLAGIVYRPPIDAQPGHYKRPSPPGPLEARIVRSSGSDFKNSDFKKQSVNAVVELLFGAPRISIQSRMRKSSWVACDSTSQHVNSRGLPKRIRIRSPKLFDFFRTIPESVGPGLDMPGSTSVVLLHPYKLFISLEPHIRQRVNELEFTNRERREKEIKFRGTQTQIGQNFGRQELPEYSPADDEEMLQHLRLLIEVFDTDLRPLFEIRRQLQDKTLPSIAYNNLWLLFEYGQDVIIAGSKLQVCRVLRWTGGREILAKQGLLTELQTRALVDAQSLQRIDVRNSAFTVDCVSFEFDGQQYGPSLKTIHIRKYDGEKPITSLPIYPLAFAQDSHSIRNRLIERGNQYLQLSRPNESIHRHYTGLTLDEPQEEIDSQIIVDAREAILRYFTNLPPLGIGNLVERNLRETYEETVNPTVKDGFCSEDGCCDNDFIHKDYDWESLREELFVDEHKTILAPTTDPDDIDDEEKILLPPFVYGFVLRNRRWATFDIDLIRDVDYSRGFEDLVLPPGHKETVRALVTNHSRFSSRKRATEHEERSIDLVKGKGKGLVILLHGAPGVGKSSTAECVADSTKRPLFPITCGDIGDSATEVESSLEKNFQLAHKWGCVLLLDEADIFLQKRDKADIKRNAIVSVFLRTMEYYSGILFLTTNRVGTFDQAFRSRIHISLYYPVLQKEATIQIWKMHLARTQALKGPNFKIRAKEILKFAKNHYMELKKAKAASWNGRQIRNAFQTAIALAEYENLEESDPDEEDDRQTRHIELNERHFATVAEASRDFDNYLRSTLGGQTDADVARLEQTRIDDFHHLVKSWEREQKSRDIKGRRKGGRGQAQLDSEDSESADSENSECSDDESGSSEESEDTAPPPAAVKPMKSKGEKKAKKQSRK